MSVPSTTTLPEVGAVEGGDDAEQGGLPAAGFADDAEAFALFDFEADAAESVTTGGAGRSNEVRGRG